MSDGLTGKQMDVVVLGAGIVGVSAAIAARQRGLSVIARRSPRARQRDVLRQCRHSLQRLDLAAQQAVAVERAAEISRQYRRGAALGHRAGRCATSTGSRAFSPTRSRRARRPRAAALHGLIGASLKLHRDWIVQGRRAASASARPAGSRRGAATPSTRRSRSRRCSTEFGIKSELLDRQAISALEPNILPVYKVGLLHTQTASVDSPGKVVKAYARMFAGSGGEIRQSEIKAIEPAGDGWRVVLGDGAISRAPCRGRARPLVGRSVAAARLSRAARVRARLSPRIHAESGTSLQRPIHDAEGSFLMSPMEQGIRVTSGVELTDRDAPSSFAQTRHGGADGARASSNSAQRSANPGAGRGRRCRTACR